MFERLIIPVGMGSKLIEAKVNGIALGKVNRQFVSDIYAINLLVIKELECIGVGRLTVAKGPPEVVIFGQWRILKVGNEVIGLVLPSLVRSGRSPDRVNGKRRRHGGLGAELIGLKANLEAVAASGGEGDWAVGAVNAGQGFAKSPFGGIVQHQADVGCGYRWETPIGIVGNRPAQLGVYAFGAIGGQPSIYYGHGVCTL